MIATTLGNSHSSNNYILKNRLISSLLYKENDRSLQQENYQFTTDQVSLTYKVHTQSVSPEKSAEHGYGLLRDLVLHTFKEQGIDYKLATDSSDIDISTTTPAEAQDLIADDGYFGVEKTSERIFKFAVGIAGGDPSRIDAIRKGVEHGFKEALDALGGRLPDISHDTYDTVMKKLDDWAGVQKSPQSQI